jgi:deoxycytidylate deaminase
MTDDGQIIAAGCNEVPRAGGGAVWEGRLADRDKDYRDFSFPCHMCARHIIATGLREVVYIEPYPKSVAKAWRGLPRRGWCATDTGLRAIVPDAAYCDRAGS